MAIINNLFPAAYATDESKLTSEANLTGIIKHITDKPSYIISKSDDTAEFVINGYYFNVSGLTADDVWAYIKIDDNNNITKEGTNNFVNFSKTQPGASFISLNLTDANNFYKFNAYSVEGILSQDNPVINTGSAGKILTTDDNKKIVASSQTVGKAYSVSNNIGSSQCTYLNAGTVTAGPTIYFVADGEDKPTTFKAGDICFTYGN